jgi:hypothetical protein
VIRFCRSRCSKNARDLSRVAAVDHAEEILKAAGRDNVERSVTTLRCRNTTGLLQHSWSREQRDSNPLSAAAPCDLRVRDGGLDLLRRAA